MLKWVSKERNILQYIYLLRAGGYYKVGITSNVSGRVSGLQYHNPEHIDVVLSKLVNQPYETEQAIHKSLESMKASGANEWFTLTPEQVIELAITINKYPDLDISEQRTLAGIVAIQKRQQKLIDKKLDLIISNYQSDFRLKRNQQSRVATVPKNIPVLPVKPAKPTPEEQYESDLTRALKVIDDEQRASTSFLQRRLSIGYGKASRILDELERQGIVGPADGAKARQVF